MVPFRQIATWWEASAEERADLLALVDDVKQVLDERYRPDGYNVGFNAGAAAGQTVDHLHLHVIPRYAGDVDDPRGGVRHVIPGRGNYLAPPAAVQPRAAAREPWLIDAGSEDRRLKLELIRCLRAEAFDRIDLVVSFIMRSGLALILDRIEDAVERGARVRILTTDYLQITDPDALAGLLDVQEASADLAGELQARVWRDPLSSFHPKAYLFSSSTTPEAMAFVGSSNLSQSGIDGGVEWNLGVDTVRPLLASFERLWGNPRTIALDHDFLRTYRRERPARDVEPVPIGVVIEPPVQPVAPTEIQREALTALEATRTDGYRAGLVVMATGLGKTWLAAFDSSRPAVRRTLFIAHREEILRQSRDVFRRVRPSCELGLYYGQAKQPDADVVFASIQTMTNRLDEFAPDAFDYVVVDEFHHAAAPSYRRVIEHFEPGFLLGLTATPERMDGADLLSLCGDNVVFDCDLIEGIRRHELVPFRYWGLRDPVDFAPIPWRNGRFDPEVLAAAVETQARAQQTLDEWRARGGGRTLGFCCSITHADFMAGFFADAGVSAVAVHSGASSAPRRDSVERLRDGELEVIFTVDVFNEGVDIPEVEAVLMLRPTDSPVVFLQQLGRGLRTSSASGKDHLRVIDFIGNHRSFLARPRTLLSLGARRTPTDRQVLDAVRSGGFDLPPGCSVAYDLDVVEMLAAMAKRKPIDALADYCVDYAAERGFRPTAVQAFRSGFNPRSAATKHRHWFGLLDDLGLLSDREAAVVRAHGDVLRAFEKEPVTKSYKLVTLRALLHDRALRAGTSVTAVSRRSLELVRADPRLISDVTGEEIPSPATVTADTWQRFWRTWPLTHLASPDRSDPLYRLTGDRLEPRFTITDDLGDTFDALVAELVEWRLAEYLVRVSVQAKSRIRCRVSHTDGRPILFLDRARHPELPEGWTPIEANGDTFEANFVKVAVNVARRPGEQANALHDLLRGWFGPSAGHPGTNHVVVLRHSEHGWLMEPETAVGEQLGTATQM